MEGPVVIETESGGVQGADEGAEQGGDAIGEELVEEISIDGMCGVY